MNVILRISRGTVNFSNFFRYYSNYLKQLEISDSNLGCFSGKWFSNGEIKIAHSPFETLKIKHQNGNMADYEKVVKNCHSAWPEWACTPAPRRGEIVRQIGDEFRNHKEALSQLITLQTGKILAESRGEVQEFIDICDYATGLSRMLNGVIFPSERPNHMLLEMWNPLGVVGVISAFNFPAAVYGWNAAIALICGNCVLWKGSPGTELVTLATTRIISKVFEKNNLPQEICSTLIGDHTIGQAICEDRRIPLVSFTGSTPIGNLVSQIVHKRFGKTILELGGNNAILVDESANIDMVISSVLFGAIGTTGQRCTTVRRLIVHEKIYDVVLQKLVAAYKNIESRIGNPFDKNTLCGPLFNSIALDNYSKCVAQCKKDNCNIMYGGEVIRENYVKPTIVTNIAHDHSLVKQETFVPILYVLKCKSLDEAILWNNEVDQGLSSSIFTNNLSNLNKWIGPLGSDCGIVNVNIPTNGAEIGAAFGGEKATGGGRESGSDSWKLYMRRSSCTINCGQKLPLAQGIIFE